MSRSFAFLPGAARHGDNVVDFRHRFNALSRRQVSPNLIRNRVSALCAPYAGANIQMRDQVIFIHGSGPFGIDIGICLHEGRCTLWLGGWHDEMPDVDMALGFVARAIDGRLRLRVQCAGHRPRKWIVECRDDGIWVEESFTCGVRMWWPATETAIYLRNAYSALPAPSCAKPAA